VTPERDSARVDVDPTEWAVEVLVADLDRCARRMDWLAHGLAGVLEELETTVNRLSGVSLLERETDVDIVDGLLRSRALIDRVSSATAVLSGD
jgi:hypothetical protein